MTYTEKILEEFDKKTIGGGGMTWEEVRQFLTAKLDQARTEERERVVGEMREYPKKLFELYNGKMPWVIFQGKADEEEKFTLYKLGFEDAMKILASLDKLKAKE